MVKPISIFISYAHADAAFLDELQKFLKPDVRNRIISVWTDRDITAGAKWDEWIKTRLKESEIILFLVTKDFLASDYIHNTEIKAAINNNNVINIPIIIRPILMSQLELNCFQVIPTGAKPIVEWPNPDNAWVDVLKALQLVFSKINGEDHGAGGGPILSQTDPQQSAVTKRAYSTDKLVMTLILFLLGASIAIFIYGVFAVSQFHMFASSVGIGLSLIGYFFGRNR